MAIDETLWIGSYSEDGFPPWPCPRCRRHSLSIRAGSLVSAETRESREAHNDPWEPHSERFVCLVECHNKRCGEVNSVAGTIDHYMQQIDDDEYIQMRHLEPAFVEPAPAIFTIPKKTPKKTVIELEAAFSLFWTDPGAALNRVRVAIECLLDAKGVQRKRLTAKRKFQRLNLDQRIEIFHRKDARTHDMMDAVKWMGNIASHESATTRWRLLEAFEIIEAILEVVIEDRQQRLGRKAREIAKRKGRPPKPPF
jgi:hypothetical protein